MYDNSRKQGRRENISSYIICEIAYYLKVYYYKLKMHIKIFRGIVSKQIEHINGTSNNQVKRRQVKKKKHIRQIKTNRKMVDLNLTYQYLH